MTTLYQFARGAVVCLLMTLMWAGGACAQQQYGPGSVGTRFWVSFPTNYEDPTAGQQYVRLYIAAFKQTKVRVYAGGTLKQTVTAGADQEVYVELTRQEAQAVTRQNNTPVPPDQVYAGKGIYVTAESPISLYGLNRTSYTSDGMLILPVGALGTEYIISTATDVVTGYFDYRLPAQYVVTAPFDSTVLTITNPVKTGSHNANTTYTVTLNTGDVYSVMSFDSGGDLSGSLIRSTKPVAVTAGNNCTFLPDGRYRACDHLEEMLSPVQAWGTAFHAIPYATRLKGDLFRIYAGADNTTVTVNGTVLGVIPKKGGGLGTGCLEYLPDPSIRPPVPVQITADKPIQVAQFNNSQSYDNIPTDPFYIMLAPVEQYQTAAIFSTPTMDYPQNYLSIVCDSAGLLQMEIAPADTKIWTNLSQMAFAAGASLRTFPAPVNGMRYAGFTFKVNPAIYLLRGPAPFTGSMYAYTSYDSYGCPITAITRNLGAAAADRQPPAVQLPQAFCSATLTGTATDMPANPALRSNLSAVELDPVSFNYLLTGAELIPGQTTAATFRLTVQDTTADAVAVVVSADMAGNMHRDTAYYRPFQPGGPQAVDYAVVFPGQKKSLPATFTNDKLYSVSVPQVQLASGTRGFALKNGSGGFVLGPAGGPSATMTLNIEFTAGQTTGNFTDTLVIADSCGRQVRALLTAAVMARPGISAGDADFGSVPVGNQAEKTAKVTNTSATTPLTLAGITGPALPAFSVLNIPAFPLTIPPGASLNLNIRFAPQAIGAYSDSVVLASNAPGADSVVALRAQGIPPSGIYNPSDKSTTGITCQVIPNPAVTESATVLCTLGQAGVLHVALYDATGRSVQVIEPGARYQAGRHQWRAGIGGLASGVYYLRLQADGGVLWLPVSVVR